MTTQGPLKALRRLAGPILAAGALVLAAPALAQQKATDWGWPQPYEKISDKSVQWLKDKGWWPLQIAFQAPWSGQNTINIVMDKQGLLAKRGIEAKLQAFPSGPAINEVMISGRFQVGNGGNFPFTSMIDKKIPVKAIAIINTNLLHALVVPNDSPLKSMKDLKGSNPPATIGIVTGSSAEFYFQMSAAYHGIELGKDVILKNMPPGEQMALPKGLTGVVPWDPTPTIMTEERKVGRYLDTSFPYNVYEGNYYVRQELIDNVPDVVQAFSDAAVEATLWTRLNPEAAVKAMQEDPNLKNYSPAILLAADQGLQQPVQADLPVSAGRVLGQGERADLQLAAPAEAHPESAQGGRLRRSSRQALHGHYLRQAGLGHPEDAALPAGKLVGAIRQDALSGVHDVG
jgi:ABC-type nitrate/sulfonate/bicarbonate transport system substrate-binding protein